ncbi:MAG: hypothetical protein ACI9YE_000583 [Psychroserpens sp.]|jgi:hypothetical protein
MLLPDDIKIYVKERLTVYSRRRYREKFRPNDFYSRIQRIPNVFMVSSFSDNYELIDNPRFCATITGTVTIEAVAKDKFCFYYGNALYKNLKGAFHIDDLFNSPQILNDILKKNLVIKPKFVQDFFRQQILYSVGANVNEHDFSDNDIHFKSISEMIVR